MCLLPPSLTVVMPDAQKSVMSAFLKEGRLMWLLSK